MGISAIAAASSATAPAYQASYPGLLKPAVAEPAAAGAMSMASADGTIPQIEIPAPAVDAAVPALKPFRSAKGEWRTDAAAPPTAAQASDTFSFADLIDIVNPLQHIPGVNLVYQHLTGDTIKPAENVAGGFLYGGVLGGMAAIAMSTIGEMWDGSATAAGSEATAVAQSGGGKFGGFATPGAVA